MSLEPLILVQGFVMEVAERTEADKKGGHLCLRASNGRLMLRESAMCPKADEAEFQNVAKHRFFNTNNLWINLNTLAATMDENKGSLTLPMIRNAKTVDPKDASTAKVFQVPPPRRLLLFYHRSTTDLTQIYHRSTTDLPQIYNGSNTDLLLLHHRSTSVPPPISFCSTTDLLLFYHRSTSVLRPISIHLLLFYHRSTSVLRPISIHLLLFYHGCALSVQLETAMGSAIESFASAGAVVVGRDRFLPVKTCNDLLLLRSDVYEMDAQGRMQLQCEKPPLIK